MKIQKMFWLGVLVGKQLENLYLVLGKKNLNGHVINDQIKVVMNYLVGTGFRTGAIKHPCITNLRTQLSSEIKKRKAKKQW